MCKTLAQHSQRRLHDLSSRCASRITLCAGRRVLNVCMNGRISCKYFLPYRWGTLFFVFAPDFIVSALCFVPSCDDGLNESVQNTGSRAGLFHLSNRPAPPVSPASFPPSSSATPLCTSGTSGALPTASSSFPPASSPFPPASSSFPASFAARAAFFTSHRDERACANVSHTLVHAHLPLLNT